MHEIDDLPLSTRFTLGTEITPAQKAFLDRHGFILFANVATPDEVAMLGSEIERVQHEWLAAGRRRVFGIPIFIGRDHDDRPFVQRLAFTSVFSDKIRAFVHDPRFKPILGLVGADARVGDREKDGVVVNRYLNVPGSVHPRLGWHTDGLRDLFYGRMPLPMLNIGLHLDRCAPANGGLRLIPGSHNQGFFSMCFRKAYFVSHKPDPAEHHVDTQPGDLTVHDGRLWHRVAVSTLSGAASLRRSMYLPYLTGPYEPKSDDSATPAYHKVGEWLRSRR